MKHVMLDLETWGTNDNAVITEIGAVRFDPEDPLRMMDCFHVCITPINQVKHFKRVIDEDTVMWWMSPERAEPWSQWFNTLKFDLPTALEGFQIWLTQGQEDSGNQPMWGNGVGFDNVILRNAYNATGQELPWNWFNDRCFRTLKSMAPRSLEPTREGTHHNALDDAKHQTRWLYEIIAAKNIIL